MFGEERDEDHIPFRALPLESCYPRDQSSLFVLGYKERRSKSIAFDKIIQIIG